MIRAYTDCLIQLLPTGNGLLIEMLESPAGQGSSRRAMGAERFPSLHTINGRNLIPVEQHNRIFQDQRAAGERIFQCLFSGDLYSLYQRSIGSLVGHANSGLRIHIKQNLEHSNLRRWFRVPWELAFDPLQQSFLALEARLSIVRSLDIARAAKAPAAIKKLRVLILAGSAGSRLGIDLKGEVRSLAEELRDSELIEVEVEQNVSGEELAEVLRRRRFHVLHFIGHGFFDKSTGTGHLALGTGRGKDLVCGKDLATLLAGAHELRLVVLNACHTAGAPSAQHKSPFEGVGTALVRAGTPAVVAMQNPITDRSAIAFSRAFYGSLMRFQSIDEAVSEGRRAIFGKDRNNPEWAVPVLLMRASDGFLFRPSDAQDAGNQAVKLLLQDDIETAVNLLTKNLEKDPENSRLRVLFQLTRLARRPLHELPLAAADSIDRTLASLRDSSDPQSARLAELVGGVLHLDFYAAKHLVPRGARSRSPGSLQRPWTSEEIELVKKIGPSLLTRKRMGIN